MKAGLDGFCVYRLLQANGIDRQVVDAASISGRPQRPDELGVRPREIQYEVLGPDLWQVDYE